MMVTVKLFGNLREKLKDYHPGNGIRHEISVGLTVAELLRQLNIPEKSGALVIQGHRIMKISDVLNDADEIQIMQPLEGG